MRPAYDYWQDQPSIIVLRDAKEESKGKARYADDLDRVPPEASGKLTKNKQKRSPEGSRQARVISAVADEEKTRV